MEINERKLGIDYSFAYFRRKFIDELWLFGDRVSQGMKDEIEIARQLKIPIIAQTAATKKELEILLSLDAQSTST